MRRILLYGNFRRYSTSVSVPLQASSTGTSVAPKGPKIITSMRPIRLQRDNQLPSSFAYDQWETLGTASMQHGFRSVFWVEKGLTEATRDENIREGEKPIMVNSKPYYNTDQLIEFTVPVRALDGTILDDPEVSNALARKSLSTGHVYWITEDQLKYHSCVDGPLRNVRRRNNRYGVTVQGMTYYCDGDLTRNAIRQHALLVYQAMKRNGGVAGTFDAVVSSITEKEAALMKSYDAVKFMKCEFCEERGHSLVACPLSGTPEYLEVLSQWRCYNCRGLGHCPEKCSASSPIPEELFEFNKTRLKAENNEVLFIFRQKKRAQDTCINCGGLGHLTSECTEELKLPNIVFTPEEKKALGAASVGLTQDNEGAVEVSDEELDDGDDDEEARPNLMTQGKEDMGVPASSKKETLKRMVW